jgi:hypothetical protein
VCVARYEPSCSPDAASVTWEETEVRGELPLPRYGHAMETLPHSGAMLMVRHAPCLQKSGLFVTVSYRFCDLFVL